MRAFASFILRGWAPAILVVVLAAVLSIVLPVFVHVGGAALALVTLRSGPRQGAIVMIGAAVVLAVFGYLSSLNPAWVNDFVGGTVLVVWLPVLLVSVVLRRTRAMGLALAVAGALAAVVLVAIHLYVGDVTSWWQSLLETVLKARLEGNPALTPDTIDAIIARTAPVMTGFLAAAIVFVTMINLFIGRWLQAIVFNPGGFREEFQALRLGGPRVALTLLVVLALSTLATGVLGNIATDLLFLVGALYSLQGLALAHAIVALKNAHVGWLVALYALMMVALLQVLLLLSAAGFVDSWMDFRKRLAVKRGSG